MELLPPHKQDSLAGWHHIFVSDSSSFLEWTTIGQISTMCSHAVFSTNYCPKVERESPYAFVNSGN